MTSGMKTIDSMWFNTFYGSFGFVVGENKIGERKLYAGVVRGLDQKVDEQLILDYGTKVNIGMLEGLISKVKEAGKKQ